MRLCLFAAAALLVAGPAAAQSLSLRYIGQQTLPSGLQAFGTTVGGLSGIDYDPVSNRFIAISDDPNNARFYDLSLTLSPTAFSAVNVTAVTTLRNALGGAYAANTIDPEAIRFSTAGKIAYASEGFATLGVNPFIREANLDGSFVRDFTVPAYYNPGAGTGIRNNLAFESLTFAQGGTRLATLTEGALTQDGPAASATTTSPSRLLLFDTLTTLPAAEYVYVNDRVAAAPAAGAFAVNGATELLSLGGTQFLALERSFTVGAPGTGYSIKLYGVDTAGATNVLGQPALAGAAFVPVSKTLLFDLGTLGIPLDNLEGLTFGPTLSNGQRSLILVADDNFSGAQTQQFLAFAVGQAVPEPATWAMMVLGFGAVGGALRRHRAVPRTA